MKNKTNNEKQMIVAFTAPIKLQHMNVFQLGTNKTYFDEGRTTYIISNEIEPIINNALESLSNFIKENSQNITLLISGNILNYLKENSIKTLNNLRRFAKSRFISLATKPYFNSHIKTMSNEELNYQIKLHSNLVKEVFRRMPKSIITNTPIENKEILKNFKLKNELVIENFQTGIHKENILLTQSFFANKTQEKITNDLNNLTNILSEINENNNCELKNHIQSELSNIFPHISKLNDENILQEWRLLSSNINHMTKQDYENYISMMNIINDLSYKLKNVELIKQGKEMMEPIILNEPSKLLTNN
ncbi:MAG: hypothetical protein AB7V77_02530 [Candidatus Woesearchaeota archaeon]